MKLKERRERFRSILTGKACVHPASVFDPLSARAADMLGFEIGMFAGSVASAVVVGAPDLTVLTLTEFAEQIRRITRASALSLLVDADHGYGNALNVMRTVEELEIAGVSALTIEDTLLPVAFGGQGSGMIEAEEMVGKLRAAISARKDPATVIVGRSGAAGLAGIPEAARRIRLYAESGVDAIFLTGVKDREGLEHLEGVTKLPLILGSVPKGVEGLDSLAGHGVRIALMGHLPFKAAVKAAYDTLSYLKSGGSPEDLTKMIASDELMEMLTRKQDYSEWRQDFLGH